MKYQFSPVDHKTSNPLWLHFTLMVFIISHNPYKCLPASNISVYTYKYNIYFQMFQMCSSVLLELNVWSINPELTSCLTGVVWGSEVICAASQILVIMCEQSKKLLRVLVYLNVFNVKQLQLLNLYSSAWKHAAGHIWDTTALLGVNVDEEQSDVWLSNRSTGRPRETWYWRGWRRGEEGENGC